MSDHSSRQHPAGQQTKDRPFKNTAAKHGGGVLGALIGGLLKSLVAKLVLAAVVAVIAYFGVATVAHLPSLLGPDLFKSQTTITESAVMTKLTKIEQVHVATANYAVDVNIDQSVRFIPCFFICNKMQLQGTGTDDAILDLSTLTPSNVNVNAGQSSVTVWIPAPAIGPAVLDPATCCEIWDSHGVVNSLTQGLHHNPNGYRPLYAEGEAQIRRQAIIDHKLLAAGEQSARGLLSRILGTLGVKHVTVNFV